jgi:hypothetical protein
MRKKKQVEEGDVRCPECGKRCRATKIEVEGIGVSGWRCGCGYELINPKEIEKAYLFMQAKKREKVKISKRGNSYMITIPKAIADAIDIDNVNVAEVFLKDKNTISIII